MSSPHERAPTVSVVIPNFNHGQYLVQAIDSVLNQTYSDFEIIIVDNNSTDNSREVVAGYTDSRVRFISFDNHGIIAAGRNHAVGHARGRLLAFLDADDVWLPDKLAVQVPHFVDESVVCVSSNFDPIGEDYRRYRTLRSRAKYRDVGYDDFLPHNPVFTSSTIVRADLFHRLSGFDEDPDFRFIEDCELWMRMSRHGRLRVLSAALIQYRVGRRVGRDGREVATRMLKIVDKHYAQGYFDQRTFKAARGACCVYIGRAFLDAGDRAGVPIYFRGLRECPGVPNKVRAAFGLALFLMPRAIRNALIETFYNARATLSNLLSAR